MSEKLVKLLQEQLEEQRKQATEQLEEQRKQHKEQLELIMTVLKGTGSAVSNAYVPPPSVAAYVPPPCFAAFDSTAELVDGLLGSVYRIRGGTFAASR